MKKILIAVLLCIGFAQVGKADTISYWRVYYNKTKLREISEFRDPQVITVKLADIKAGDSIIVTYHPCSPCSDCTATVIAANENRQVIAWGEGKGSRNPVSFSLEAIKNSGLEYIEVFYFEGAAYNRAGTQPLFRIKLE